MVLGFGVIRIEIGSCDCIRVCTNTLEDPGELSQSRADSVSGEQVAEKATPEPRALRLLEETGCGQHEGPPW